MRLLPRLLLLLVLALVCFPALVASDAACCGGSEDMWGGLEHDALENKGAVDGSAAAAASAASALVEEEEEEEWMEGGCGCGGSGHHEEAEETEEAQVTAPVEEVEEEEEDWMEGGCGCCGGGGDHEEEQEEAQATEGVGEPKHGNEKEQHKKNQEVGRTTTRYNDDVGSAAQRWVTGIVPVLVGEVRGAVPWVTRT